MHADTEVVVTAAAAGLSLVAASGTAAEVAAVAAAGGVDVVAEAVTAAQATAAVRFSGGKSATIRSSAVRQECRALKKVP